MPIVTQVKEKDGVVHTKVVETEGAMEAVRNYTNPAEAVEYLNSKAAYYNQPAVPESQIEKGTKVTTEEGEEVLQFVTIQGAVAYLSGKKPPVASASEPKKEEEGEPEPKASAEDQEPTVAKGKAEDETPPAPEGKEGAETPPAKADAAPAASPAA